MEQNYMARIKGPLFSMEATGSFGNIVFDRRGFARYKATGDDAQTPGQGNVRQTMAAAQHCVGICGPNTRELLKGLSKPRSQWPNHLVSHYIGLERATFQQNLEIYGNGVDRDAWEVAADEMGLIEASVPYAEEPAVSPGAQLFMLAATLYDFDIYAEFGNPAGNGAEPDVQGWKNSIMA
jgi:hypothetical protein